MGVSSICDGAGGIHTPQPRKRARRSSPLLDIYGQIIGLNAGGSGDLGGRLGAEEVEHG